MNLAETRNRPVQQASKVSGRAPIIPERRDTRAPELETFARMATARRGDGGAQDLLRTLGMVENAASNFQQYSQNAHAQREEQNITQGYADQQTGNVNEEMMEKSDGYRNAVTKGRTVTGFSTARREFWHELEEVIESQDSPFLEERQAEVATRIEQFFHDFALDPETGKPKDFMNSAGAMRYLIEAIGQSRQQFAENASKRIEERFNTEAFGHFSQNFVDQARETGGVDFAAARSLLPATVTNEQIAEHVLIATRNAANALFAEGRIEEATRLLGSLRGYSTQPLEVPVGTAGPTGEAAPASSAVSASYFTNPVGTGEITSRFGAGRSGGRTHNGVDIAVPVGTPVRSAMGGEVLRVWNSEEGGLSVRIRYDDGTVVGFAHLSEAQLTKGQRVNPGDTVALTGNTGRSTGPHLHYTMTRDGKKLDPTTAAPGAPAQPTVPDTTPGYRLSDPFEDPVTVAQRVTPVGAGIVGLEGVTFSATQQARINELYDVSTDQMRRQWKAKVAEEQSENATRLALGLFNVGGTTTRQDILDARTNHLIDDETMLALLRTQQSNEEQRQNAIDRQLDRVDREEAQRNRRMEEAAVGSLVGALTRGDINAAELRQATLSLLPDLPPAIQGSVLGTTLSIANGMESALANGSPARRFTDRWTETSAGLPSRVVEWGIIPSQRKTVQALAESAIETGQAKFLQRVIAGENPDKVAEEIDAEIGRVHGALARQYGPKQ